MASETQIRTYPCAAAWPPDDTEESILGTDLHQTTITNLRWGINEAARLHRPRGGAIPWQASGQILFLGCVHLDGTDYRTYPDIFVYPRPIDQNRGSMALVVDGAPVLIVEVLSESTYAADLSVERGKVYSYARAGVREYLALDPTGHFMPEGVRAWRLAGDAYRPWERGVDGRWHSEQIGVAIGLEGVLATVFAHDGRRMLREGEVVEELERRDAELERRDAELERRDAELQQTRAELEQMRRLLDERRA